VAQDTESMKALIQQFVAAYNEANKFLSEQTRYNPDTKTSATLQGDRIAVALQGQLRALVATQSDASPVFGTLSSAGISLQRDGSLKVDDGKLAAALTRLPELAKLFSAEGGGNPLAIGIARRFDVLADANSGTGGSLESREDGLKQRLSRNRTEQERFNDRMAMVEARLRAQYTALDNKMAQLNGLSAYVTQQVQLLNNSNNN
jgi:flagellar hook-associated protein 2